jgi:hypothetical protein
LAQALSLYQLAPATSSHCFSHWSPRNNCATASTSCFLYFVCGLKNEKLNSQRHQRAPERVLLVAIRHAHQPTAPCHIVLLHTHTHTHTHVEAERMPGARDSSVSTTRRGFPCGNAAQEPPTTQTAKPRPLGPRGPQTFYPRKCGERCCVHVAAARGHSSLRSSGSLGAGLQRVVCSHLST